MDKEDDDDDDDDDEERDSKSEKDILFADAITGDGLQSKLSNVVKRRRVNRFVALKVKRTPVIARTPKIITTVVTVQKYFPSMALLEKFEKYVIFSDAKRLSIPNISVSQY